MTNPLVSLIIPTYNDSTYVCDAVDSCLAQTYPHCEVIVVDDGSTDGTGDLLAARYGDRIRYTYQENRGLPAARNTGTRLAQGEFVNYCDADDQLHPEKIARSLPLFAEHPDAAVIYSDFMIVADDGVTPLPRHPQAPRPDQLPSGDIFRVLLAGPWGDFIAEGAPLLRRVAVVDAGGFNETLRAAEDWEMWLRLAIRHPFVCLPEPMLLYRLRPNAMHTNPIRMAAATLRVVELVRDYPGREKYVSDSAMRQIIGEQHHLLAYKYWQENQRAAARAHFRQANQFDPLHALARRVNILLSYAFPASSSRVLLRLRPVLKLFRRASNEKPSTS